MFASTTKRFLSAATTTSVRKVPASVIGFDFGPSMSDVVLNEEISPFGQRIDLKDRDGLNRTQESVMGDYFTPANHEFDTLGDHLNFNIIKGKSFEAALLEDSFSPVTSASLVGDKSESLQSISLSEAMMGDYFIPNNTVSLM